MYHLKDKINISPVLINKTLIDRKIILWIKMYASTEMFFNYIIITGMYFISLLSM